MLMLHHRARQTLEDNNQALSLSEYIDIKIESKEEAAPRVNAATLLLHELLDDNAAAQMARVKYW